MGLLDRDYMRQAPRWHAGERGQVRDEVTPHQRKHPSPRPVTSAVYVSDAHSPLTRQQRPRYTVFWVTLVVLLTLVAVGAALLLGVVRLP